MALIHLFYTLIKIAILASIYALIISLIYKLFNYIIPRFKPDNSDDFNPPGIWKPTAIIISTGLFIFSFTYWGNHGLGDEYRIPIRFKSSVNNGDGVSTYFVPKNQELGWQIHFIKFKVLNNYLCASLEDNLAENPYKYMIYNFKTDSINKFVNKTDYDKYAFKNGLPQSDEFIDFMTHYGKYWHGWRLLLLP